MCAEKIVISLSESESSLGAYIQRYIFRRFGSKAHVAVLDPWKDHMRVVPSALSITYCVSIPRNLFWY